MVQTIKEDIVARAFIAQGLSIDSAKEALIGSNNRVTLQGTVYNVYGKRVLAIMHKLLDSTNPKVTWSVRNNIHIATLSNKVEIGFLKARAVIVIDNSIVDSIKYTQRSKENAVKVIKIASKYL